MVTAGQEMTPAELVLTDELVHELKLLLVGRRIEHSVMLLRAINAGLADRDKAEAEPKTVLH